MKNEIDQKLKSLRSTKQDFLRSAKRTAETLREKQESLAKKLERANERLKRTKGPLDEKAGKVASLSISSAQQTQKALKVQIVKSKKTASGARSEGREVTSQLRLVCMDLADAFCKMPSIGGE